MQVWLDKGQRERGHISPRPFSFPVTEVLFMETVPAPSPQPCGARILVPPPGPIAAPAPAGQPGHSHPPMCLQPQTCCVCVVLVGGT